MGTTETSTHDWVEVGYILRPHGVRGELRVVLHAPEEGFPKSIESVRLVHPKQGEQSAVVVSARPSKDAILMRLESIRDRDEAQRWKGSAVMADANLLPEPEHGYHVFELVGTGVQDQSGQRIGEIVGFLDNSAHFLLRIGGPRGERLLPYVDEFVQSYDRETDTLTVNVPDGLWDEEETSS